MAQWIRLKSYFWNQSAKKNSLISKILNDKWLKDLLSGGGIVLVFKVLGALSGYLFAFIVGKSLGAESFGTYELAFTVLMILGTFGRLGLDGALVRFLAEWQTTGEHGKILSLYKQVILHGTIISVSLGVVLFFLSPWLGSFYGGETTIISFKYVTLALPFYMFLTLNLEAIRGFKKMIAFSIFQNGSVLLLASAILFIGSHFDIPTLELPMAAFTFALMVVSVISGLSYFRIQSRELKSSHPTKVEMSRIYKVALPMLVSGALFYIISWTDVLMIGYFENEKAVGVYRIAFKIATLITFTQFAINSFVAPSISELNANKANGAFRRLLRQVGVINFWMATPPALVIFIFPDFMLSLFGPEYASAMVVLKILAVGQLLNALCGPVLYILNMTGKEKDSQKIMFVVTFINIFLNAILIPIYGIEGAAWATSISMIAWNISAVYFVVKYYEVWPVSFLDKIFYRGEKG